MFNQIYSFLSIVNKITIRVIEVLRSFLDDITSFLLLKVRKYPLLGLVVALFFVALYIGAWYGAKDILYWDGLLSTVHNWYSQLGVNAGFKTDISIINTVSGIIAVLVPFSLTFLYFSYKEQKSLSISTVSFSSGPIFAYVFLCVGCLILGRHLSISLNANIDKLTFGQLDRKYTGLLVLWFALICWFFYQCWKMISDHLSNMNVQNQINFATKQIHKNLDKLVLSITTSQKKFHTTRASNNVDSLYQLLFLAIEKNSYNFYSVGIENWKTVLGRITNDGDQDIAKYVIESKNSFYDQLYKCILTNHVTLIKKLLTTNRLEDVNQLFEILEQVQSKKSSYYTALHELSFITYKTEALDIFLDRLENVLRVTKHKKGNANEINTVYKQILVLATEDNKVQIMSKTINSMMKNFVSDEKQKLKGFIPLPRLNNEESKNDLNECILYMLMQCLVKSIEIGNYSVTGFLIKYIVTNFRWEFVKRVYGKLIETLVSSKNGNNPYLQSNELSNIKVSFNFNMSTLRYCVEKMSLLLYSQQRFSIEKGAPALYKQKRFNIISVSKMKFNLNYLEEKISKVGDKYGLLCVTSNVTDKKGQSMTYLQKMIRELTYIIDAEKVSSSSSSKAQ